MNAFQNLLETLLGLSAEPKDLTFVQISLRGIIVFLATLIMVRLGHKRSLAHKPRSTPSCWSFSPRFFHARATVRQLSLPPSAERSLSSCYTGPSPTWRPI